MDNSDLPKYLTLEEVAVMLRVSQRTVHRLIKKKEIPAFKIGDSWRVDTMKLVKQIESKTIKHE